MKIGHFQRRCEAAKLHFDYEEKNVKRRMRNRECRPGKGGLVLVEEEGKQKFAVSAVCRRKCRLAATIFETTLF